MLRGEFQRLDSTSPEVTGEATVWTMEGGGRRAGVRLQANSKAERPGGICWWTITQTRSSHVAKLTMQCCICFWLTIGNKERKEEWLGPGVFSHLTEILTL